jgi:hypothetical protein
MGLVGHVEPNIGMAGSTCLQLSRISTLPFVYPGLEGFALEAGVTILLAQLGRLLLPALRDLALLDRRLLLLGSYAL